MAGKDAKDLLDLIDMRELECLNAKGESVQNAFKQGYREQDELVLESDADEQLLLNIPFNQKVKLQSIVIKGPADSGPRLVRLWANRGHLGFSDVQGSVPVSQEFTLTEAQLTAGEPIPLKMVKFATTVSLAVFIEDNQSGSETTKVSKIALFGQPGEVFDVAQIKKAGEEHQ